MNDVQAQGLIWAFREALGMPNARWEELLAEVRRLKEVEAAAQNPQQAISEGIERVVPVITISGDAAAFAKAWDALGGPASIIDEPTQATAEERRTWADKNLNHGR